MLTSAPWLLWGGTDYSRQGEGAEDTVAVLWGLAVEVAVTSGYNLKEELTSSRWCGCECERRLLQLYTHAPHTHTLTDINSLRTPSLTFSHTFSLTLTSTYTSAICVQLSPPQGSLTRSLGCLSVPMTSHSVLPWLLLCKPPLILG